MNKKLNKVVRNRLLTLLLFVTMMVTVVIPTWAQEVSIPDISSWAIEDLNEGERYGIYPMEWYYDGFKAQYFNRSFKYFNNKYSEKITALELDKNDKFIPIPHEGDKPYSRRYYNKTI